MRTGVTFALLIALCVLFTLHGSTAPVNADPSPAVNNSDTVIEIQLQPTGDANISVKTIVPIEDTNDTAGFNVAAQEFEAGSGQGNSIDSFRHAATAASNASNRSMSIDNESIDRTTARDGDVGMFILEFTWRNFANRSTTENGRYLRVNDAFTTNQGTWLPGLAANQTLKIRRPEGYYISKSPRIRHVKRSLVLSGPQVLEPGYINITYSSDRPPSTEETPGPGPPSDLPQGLIGVTALILLVALGSVGVFAFSRRDRLLRRVKADGGIGTGGGGPESGSLSTTEERDAHSPDTAAGADADTDIDADPNAAPDSEPSLDNGINVDLLSDEERVERLLEDNGGRMKQANIVRETDWSNAKVSQLLSSMDEDERIEKLRIGRENLISLPDHGKDDQNRS